MIQTLNEAATIAAPLVLISANELLTMPANASGSSSLPGLILADLEREEHQRQQREHEQQGDLESHDCPATRPHRAMAA